jgi:hypothetical protein
METSEGTTKADTEGGGKKRRAFWPEYNPDEEATMKPNQHERWDDLSYLNDFWNAVYDKKDLEQYRQMAKVWQLRELGLSFRKIGERLGLDQRKACGFVTGFNRRPYLAAMYLNHEMLGRPREGWKWILECTPKPTNPYPKALLVPERISDYKEILEFLRQFPPVRENSKALRFFGLTSKWTEDHRGELFWFLLAFLIGDGGKQYVHNEYRSRHYKKTAMTTRMTYKYSNFRVLRFVQLALESIGIPSHQVKSEDGVVRWNSEATNVITWMMQECIGLEEGQSTSHSPVRMPWIINCPNNLITSFLQGLADSDGYVDKKGRYSEIASVPNAKFYADLIHQTGFEAKAYPLGDKPRTTRLSIETAARLPLFNPIIRSYRFEELVTQAQQRNIPPPPSLF